MIYYAIRNIKTGRYIAGTDFSYADGRPRQIMNSPSRPPKLFTGPELLGEIKRRGINQKRYDVVAVEVKEASE